MKYGSFDTAIASSKLSYVEKYKKSTMQDLNMFRDVLGVEVSISADGKRATIMYGGQATDVEIV